MFQNEGYHPHAASTYLTEHEGGIYSVEKGRHISGFTSRNLPLNVTHVHPKTNWEDTESQYADELRRQAYFQTLGEKIVQIATFLYLSSVFQDFNK